MPPFRRHERRVGQDHVGVVVPALLAREGVVLENVRLDKAVQVEVDQRQANHVGRDVVALEVGRESAFFVGRQRGDRGYRGCMFHYPACRAAAQARRRQAHPAYPYLLSECACRRR